MPDEKQGNENGRIKTAMNRATEGIEYSPETRQRRGNDDENRRRINENITD